MFDPYGQVTICNPNGSEKLGEARVCSAFGNPFFFTGRRNDDETRWFDSSKLPGKEWQQGLMQFRNRMYSVDLGRFVSRDPIGYADGMGLYQYTYGSPTCCLDPMGTKFTVPYRRWYDKEKKGPVHKAVGDRFAAALNFLCPLGWQFDQLTEEISTKNPDACKDYMKANAAKGDWCCCLCKVVDTDVRLVMQVGYPNSITRVFKKFRQEFDANEIAVVDSIDVIMTDRAFQMDGKDFTFDEVLGHELCTHGKLFIEQRHPSPADMRIDWKTADNKQKLAYEQAVIDRAEEDKMRKLHDPSLSPRAPVKAIPDGKDHYKKDASTPLMPIGEAVYDQIFPRVKKP